MKTVETHSKIAFRRNSRASFFLGLLLGVMGLTFDALSANAETVTREVGPDLPPIGASMFDLYLASIGGIDSMPSEFTKLQSNLQSHSTEPERPLNALLIPFGRSLQKPLSIEPSPLMFPRVVVAMGSQVRDVKPHGPRGRLHMKSRLYVGYHEPKDQIEVISWNERGGRFEFQIVKNYGLGKKASIVYAPRSLCMTCHLGGGPIFPIAPWAELNADISMAALIHKTRSEGGDSGGFYQGVRIQDHEDDSQNFPKTRKGTAQLFENTVFNAERLLRSQKYWKDLCGQMSSPATCRRQLIYSAALRNLARTDDLESPDRIQVAPYHFSFEKAQREFQFQDPLLRPRGPLFDLAQSLELQQPFSIEGARLHIEKLFAALSPPIINRVVVATQKIQERFLLAPLPEEEDPQKSRALELDRDSSTLFGMAVHSVGMALLADYDRELESEYQLFKVDNDSDVSFDFVRTPKGFRQVSSNFNDSNEGELAVEILAPSAYGTIYRGLVKLRHQGFNLQCLESDGGRIFCRNLSFTKLLARLNSLDPQFFQSNVIPDRLIMAHLLNRPRDDQNDLYAKVAKPEEMGHESLDRLIPRITNKKLKLTMESCGRCHFGEDSVAPTLFAGETEFELFEAVRKNADEMSKRFLRANKPMPPSKSEEYAHISSDPEKAAELRSFIELMRQK